MNISVKRALLSVANKSHIVDFAKALINLNIEILATGGTSLALSEAGIPHQTIETITGFAHLFDGRLKTLHPKIQGGILGKRDKHQAEALKHDIPWIDLVVVNFYPFAEAKQKALSPQEMIEYIDIGGPTMVRSAAKNFEWVGVVVDPNDYAKVLEDLTQQQTLDANTRRYLAVKAFALTSHYDAMIHQYFTETELLGPQELTIQAIKKQSLRYGENPHQKACVYQFPGNVSGILSAKLHQGKPLSYNNIVDAEAAVNCVHEFAEPTAVIVKHANPCGVSSADNIEEAFEQAFNADPLSAFGGIIALNRACSRNVAEHICDQFVELVIAPQYEEEALRVFSQKKNLRILQLPLKQAEAKWEMKFLSDGVLWQEKDLSQLKLKDLDCVTTIKPSEQQLTEMLFAWRVVKHLKSNAIVISANHVTLGMSGGQVSRIDAVDQAIRKASYIPPNAVLASDAFFPFRDSIDSIAVMGIKAIIQPGGSIKDAEVITACEELGIAMIFTYQRCFRH